MATPDESSPFRCSICFNSKEGQKPRGLPCLHSFCNDCLKQWHEKRYREGHCAKTQVECPTCRTKVALPSGDVSGLPLDINVQQFAEYFTNESKFISCQLCKVKIGKAACVMCHVLLCEDCSDKHKKSPLFASRDLTRNICEFHGAALQGVCTTCLCGVCLHCVDEDRHKDHSLQDMPSGIKTIKSKVGKYTSELEELVRTGDANMNEKRKYMEQIQCVEEMKGTLDMMKREIQRLEKEIADHERLCKAKIDAVFKEYQALSKRASERILNVFYILEEQDTALLDKLRSGEVPDEQMCSQLRTALSSLPEVNAIAISECKLENVNKALVVLINCKVVCGIPDVAAISFLPGPPVEVFKITWGKNQDIHYPWRLCGTPEGDVIVCDDGGGPVYKVYKDGTKTRLLDDGIVACVHGGDVYVISTDGCTVTQIKQEGSTVKHKLKPSISGPHSFAVSDENVFISTSKSIIKLSLRDPEYRKTLNVEGCEDLGHLLKIDHGGMTKLVVTNENTHEVIICDEAGSVLTRFGSYGSEDGLLGYPSGISRLSYGHLLVADWENCRIVEYKMDGTFVRNLLTVRDGLHKPEDIVYKYPYLWVVERSIGYKNIKLFKF